MHKKQAQKASELWTNSELAGGKVVAELYDTDREGGKEQIRQKREQQKTTKCQNLRELEKGKS